MDKEVVWFIRLSIIYFLLGSALGVLFVLKPETADQYHIAMHVHFNLIGWMSMMIFGVGYHILPRFSGQHLYSRRMSIVQFWLANIGLVGMSAGWGMMAHGHGGKAVLAVFGVITFLSFLLFGLNMFMTIKGPEPAPPGA